MSNLDNDAELTKALTASLDASLSRFDQETLAQLALARQKALYRQRNVRRGAVGLAAAATIAAVAVVPWYSNHKTVDTANALVSGGELLDVDPQLLSDMDLVSDMEMIDALGEIASTQPSPATANNGNTNDS